MYLDPGFGGMLLQVIIAIIAVAGGVLFSLRKKIKKLFSKDKPGAEYDDTHSIQDVPDDAVDMLGDAAEMPDKNKK